MSEKPFRWLVIWENGDETTYDHPPPRTPRSRREVIKMYREPQDDPPVKIERDPWGQTRTQPRRLRTAKIS